MTDHRLFFAAQPDSETAQAIAAFAADLRRAHGLGGAVRAPQLLHITLAFVGRTPGPPAQDVIDHALQAGAAVTARPFVVALNRVQKWTPVVLVGDEGVVGVDLLHARLARALGREPDPSFKAHMSLIWNARPLAERAAPPIRFAVREFVLIRSIQGQGRHDVLGRWPLAPPKNA
jgi:2'-5' RNA ligase